MRRSASLLLLFCLVVTGAAPLAGERLLCPMPMAAVGASCETCVMDSPEATASLQAASCCSVAPATVAETVPATVSATRRGSGFGVPDAAPMSAAIIACPEVSTYVPSFDAPAPDPAPTPPLHSTQTTHLRN